MASVHRVRAGMLSAMLRWMRFGYEWIQNCKCNVRYVWICASSGTIVDGDIVGSGAAEQAPLLSDPCVSSGGGGPCGASGGCVGVGVSAVGVASVIGGVVIGGVVSPLAVGASGCAGCRIGGCVQSQVRPRMRQSVHTNRVQASQAVTCEWRTSQWAQG